MEMGRSPSPPIATCSMLNSDSEANVGLIDTFWPYRCASVLVITMDSMALSKNACAACSRVLASLIERARHVSVERSHVYVSVTKRS